VVCAIKLANYENAIICRHTNNAGNAQRKIAAASKTTSTTGADPFRTAFEATCICKVLLESQIKVQEL
jgi:hypothetical protein